MAVSLQLMLAEHTMASADELVQDAGGGAVRCVACGHRCLIKDGRVGVCRIRFNRGGELRVPTGYVAGLQVDPIEKKPFFHAFPGRDALSFGMLGCDYHCSYCQNWITSQVLRDDTAVAAPRFCTSEEIVRLAQHNNALVMVSTYNEPLITSDWSMMIFEKAREAGIVCGFVSNGNATPEVLDYIRPAVDLYKVDLKSFRDKAYRQLGGTLQAVLDTIPRLKAMGFWVEIVTLVVPGFNDSTEELTDIGKFIASVSTDIPWHVTAFHPDYKMTDPPRTQVDTLIRAYDIGRSAGLKFVYTGNLPGRMDDRENTRCPHCDATMIERKGFYVTANRMRAGRCGQCDGEIPGVWEENAPTQSQGTGIPKRVGV